MQKESSIIAFYKKVAPVITATQQSQLLYYDIT